MRHCLTILALLTIATTLSQAALEIEESARTRQLFYAGAYTNTISTAEAAIDAGKLDPTLHEYLIKALLETGQYSEALLALTRSEKWFGGNPRLYLLAREVYRMNQEPEKARQVERGVYRAGYSYGLSVRSAADMVAFGRLSLIFGQEPRQVMKQVYERALEYDETCADAIVAIGDLAIDKYDYELAANKYRQALKINENHVDALLGLARAFEPSDPEMTSHYISQVLSLNPHHSEAKLMLISRLIDYENYAEAKKRLDEILDINPYHPIAWAYHYVFDVLDNDPESGEASLVQAYRAWEENPEVPYSIAAKLSRKRRFAESVSFCREAVQFDENHLSARILLAQDLLRLGRGAEAWPLVERLQEEDEYNVVLYNLINLYDRLQGFHTESNEHFIVRMDPEEFALIGEEVMTFMQEAHDVLNQKYGLTLDRPVVVEFFREQQDFAVRTIGVPGGIGLLGACFGSLITMNSPGSLGAMENNWKSVLWHEYCHVVTLTATRNRMPRWLSEGISVYEELQREKSWGQRMTPAYRDLILHKGELYPISKLSDAFLKPKSSMHFMFGYYQSAMVVEYIIDTFGFDAFQHVLVDLHDGLPVNAAIEKHTTAMPKLEADFQNHMKEYASNLGKGLDWQPLPETADFAEFQNWLKLHPESFYGLNQQAAKFIEAQKYEEAIAPLEKIIKHFPEYVDEGNAYAQLGFVYQKLGRTEDEIKVLEILTENSARAITAFKRLMELSADEKNWQRCLLNAQRLIDVNPTLTEPYRQMARSAENIDQPERAIFAYERLLRLQPEDPAATHYQLARLLKEKDSARAKRHVLQALAEAPRYREAHRLLRELTKGDS